MQLLDLFSGIGGFHLAAEWVWGDELECVGHVEIDPFCQKVLNKHWPGVPIYDDIRKIKGEQFGAVDIITGGFPCQPFSQAGKRKGKADDRFLWPEMLRVIEEVQPRWVLGENVAGIVNMELDNVLSDLESKGYETQAFIIPACAVDAKHRRDRVWIVGYSKSSNARQLKKQNSGHKGEVLSKNRIGLWHELSRPSQILANSTNSTNRTERGQAEKTNGIPCECGQTGCAGVSGGTNSRTEVLADTRSNATGATGRGGGTEERNIPQDITNNRDGVWGESAKCSSDASNTTNQRLEREKSKSEFSRGQSGLLAECSQWQPESDVGRVAHGVPDRVDRLKSLGNAVVPQVAEFIGKIILKEIEKWK